MKTLRSLIIDKHDGRSFIVINCIQTLKHTITDSTSDVDITNDKQSATIEGIELPAISVRNAPSSSALNNWRIDYAAQG